MSKFEVNKKVVAKASMDYYCDQYQQYQLGLEERKVVAMNNFEVNKKVVAIACMDFYLKLRPRVVKEREVILLSRQGRFYRTLPVGFHLTVPNLDRVMSTMSVEEQNIVISDMLARS